MIKSLINTNGLPQPFGYYSTGLSTGNYIFLSGQGPFDENQNLVGEGNLEVQTRKTLENIKALLEQNGLGMENIVRCTVFLNNIGDWALFNKIYGEYFIPPYPARTVVGCNLNGFLIEIECTVVCG
jgi:2-iminobutanoate/2-iminopropanoate deaminase